MKSTKSPRQSEASETPAADTRPTKPQKPRPDFPLFPHATGRWAKKIRGRLHYFGKWTDDPKGERAILKWLDEKDDLLAGRQARPKGDAAAPTVKLICDSFLTQKEQQRDNGEIRPCTFNYLFKTCVRIGAAFGKDRLVSDLRPDDFRQLRGQLAKRLSPVTLGVEIQRVRSVFKFAYDDDVIENPVKFGKGFQKPSRKTLLIERNKKGARDLQADQIRRILDKSNQQMKAIILLAVNCGFGNQDVGSLPISALDLDGGWVEYPRPKTGVMRRAKLWPETIEAIRGILADDGRAAPADKQVAKLVFRTRAGASWAKEDGQQSPVSKIFHALLTELGLYREGLGFYSLRRTFETIGGDSLDQVSVDFVMGHSPSSNDMASVYRQRINDQRLEAVSEHVRAWLFPVAKQPQ